MGFVGKICSIGVWDESIPGIEFDNLGKSNYAKLYQTLADAYPRGEKGKQLWQTIVSKINKSGIGKKYDCIIGVSGGTDSCYLLHLAKEAGLRPLAVNLDNGWNTDISVRNIKNMTTKLEIDLETYVIDYEEIKDLLRSYMYAGLPWIDIPTDLAIKAILYKIASREGIKYVLRGNDFRTEGSQPEEWTYGDGRQLKHVHKKFGKVKLKTFPNYTLFSLLYYGLIRKVKSIYPFYYIDYNKSVTQQFLQKNYDWQYYGGHHHENYFTKFAISYWLYAKFGIDKRKITYSALILNHELSRNEAVDLINILPYDETEISKSINFVLKKLELTQGEFDKIMTSENKTYNDYKSYSKLFSRMQFLAKFILKWIFIHKPQSLYQAEMRSKK